MRMDYGSLDLGRTRFVSSPMLNLIDGVFTNDLAGSKSLLQQRWWRTARRLVPIRALPLVELINAAPGFQPGFLYPEAAEYPGAARHTLREELDVLRALPEERIAAEAEAYIAAARQEPPKLWDGLRSGGSAIARLVDMAHALFEACLAADWPDLQRRIDREISLRGHQMAVYGAAAVLNDVHPRLSWHDGALNIQTEKNWAEVPGPGGRGFVLMPDLMTSGMTATTTGADQPLLGYSLVHEANGVGVRPGSLATLIGAGRERALRAVGSGCSTTELATRLGIKPPAASAHAAALRAAGLLVTAREGYRVRHVLTLLGADLLAANPQ